MANILGNITVDEVDVLEVDSDPSAGAGTPANCPGSLAIVKNVGGGIYELWQKTGTADTAWEKFEISTGAGGKRDQAGFFGQGVVGNKWLAVGSSSKGSDDIPCVVVDDVEISAISWSNANTALNVTIEIYKNGINPGDLVASFPILNKKTMAKTNITPISCSHGDRLSVYINKGGGTNATDPKVTLYFQVITGTNSEVST